MPSKVVPAGRLDDRKIHEEGRVTHQKIMRRHQMLRRRIRPQA